MQRRGTLGARPTAQGMGRDRMLLIGFGFAVIVATYVFLIATRSASVGKGLSGGTDSLVALGGYLLGALLIIWGAVPTLPTATVALIPVAIAINIAVGQLVSVSGIPLYLDSIGTILVAVLAGPWAGAATGALANVIWGVTINPVSLPFAVTACEIGLMAGLFARLGAFRRFFTAPIAGLITGIISALISAPIAAFVFGGVTGTGTDALVAAWRAYGNSILAATTKQGLTSDPLDKLITFSIVFLILFALPPRMRARFTFAQRYGVFRSRRAALGARDDLPEGAADRTPAEV